MNGTGPCLISEPIGASAGGPNRKYVKEVRRTQQPSSSSACRGELMKARFCDSKAVRR